MWRGLESPVRLILKKSKPELGFKSLDLLSDEYKGAERESVFELKETFPDCEAPPSYLLY